MEKSVFLNIRLTPEDKQAIKAKAREQGISAAELIRRSVLGGVPADCGDIEGDPPGLVME